MNPPRWDTPNTGLVRDELMRRVEAEATSPARTERHAPDGLRAVGGPRPMWVTMAVGLVVLLLTIAVVSAVHVRARSGPPAEPGTTEESALLLQELPSPVGRVLHTWTQNSTGDRSGSFDAGLNTPVVAGACSGGGTLAITDPGGTTRTLDCSTTAVLQPSWPRDAEDPRLPAVPDEAMRVRVAVVSGEPLFVVRLWAVDPKSLKSDFEVAQTSSAVPTSLRNCTTADLAERASFSHPDAFQRGLVTITNRSSTDCAVRAWPTVQPLDADLRQIGPSPRLDQQRSLDGAEGNADVTGRFPPARLAAGRQGYFITDFDTLTDLKQQDLQARAEAAGAPGSSNSVAPADRTAFCDARSIAALRFTVGPAVVTAPAEEASLGACAASAQNLDLNPVVAERPTRD